MSRKFTYDAANVPYYGNRYYSPSLGRFLNRDPIEEAGGANLYGFCGNDPVNGYDVLGNFEGPPPKSFFDWLDGMRNLTSGQGGSGGAVDRLMYGQTKFDTPWMGMWWDNKGNLTNRNPYTVAILRGQAEKCHKSGIDR